MRQAFAWAFFKAHNVGRRTPSTPKPGHIALSPRRAGASEPFGMVKRCREIENVGRGVSNHCFHEISLIAIITVATY